MSVEMIRAKHRQATALMAEHGIDSWLIEFARETGMRPDPLGYLVGGSVTWPSAFLLNKDGTTAAIVGTGDAGTFEATGLWTELRAFRDGPREDLLDVLNKWDPQALGVTWSESDDTADGITHGMYRLLESLLAGTRFADRLVSAGGLASDVRGIKLPEEVEAIARTVQHTERLLERIERRLEPGITEIGLQREVHGWVHEAGWKFSWDDEYCPMVNFGPPPFMGHAGPTDHALQPGDVIHVDIGLIVDGFASDLQRTWYWRRPGETEPPPDVRRAFDAVKAALDAGVAAIKPGAKGFEVDAAARATVEEWDFEEPGFAFGHGCGRVAHDGSGLLGPEWERYGDSPRFTLREGNVFAVEMDLEVPGHGGVIGLEEEVVVTPEGARYLSNPQRELILLPALR
jgi:Xaa-Pro aminopeptidase